MQLSNIPGKLVLPFANAGGKSTIPVASQIGITAGAASLTDGFPPLTRTPIAAGGVPPSGLDMNGILYEMSAIIRWANAGGGYPYDSAFATDANVGGYPKGARIMRSDGTGYWFNTAENNVTDPEGAGAAAAGWVPDFTTGAATVAMASSSVTLTPVQYGKPLIVITGTLTANLNLIFPAIVGLWTVINSTTGNYTITAKTASGTGVSVPQGYPLPIVGNATSIYSSTSYVADAIDLNVKRLGAKWDGSTNDASVINTAIAALPANSVLRLPAGIGRGYLLIWRSDIAIIGAGRGATTLKLPDNCPSITVPHEGGGTLTGLPNVVEIGQCALGNSSSAFSGVTVDGFTIDGNYANNTAPTVDLFGHGCIITNTSKCHVDVAVKNCHLTGVDNVINSDYNKIDAYVENCGNATPYGSHYPNFDINSSHFCQFDVVSNGGYYGGRMLDNCWGNFLRISVNNPNVTGVVYDNQTVNASYANTIHANIVNGCTNGQGVSIGSNCYNSQIFANVKSVVGVGMLIQGASTATAPRGNKINLDTYSCGAAGLVDKGLYNQIFVNSRYDGATGAAGSNFAVDVYGSYNQYIVNIEDKSTPQVRGFVFRSGAQSNNLIDYCHNVTVQDFNNQDISNTNRFYFQYGNGTAGQWFNASLNSGWSNTYGSPFPAAGYTIDQSGRVTCRGTVNGGTATIFTLPVNFRPTSTMLFSTIANGATGRLQVDSSGNVTLPTGTATGVDLSSISFYIY